MTESHGFIEVDYFPEEVDSLDYPEVIRFKEALEGVAEEYDCNLSSFDIDRGTVVFSFDSDELMAEILRILQNDTQGQA